MHFCTSTVRYSVLVNGEASRSFSSFGGLRRGDPLSPLFTLVMETLSRSVNKALKGYHITNAPSESMLISFAIY